MSKIELSSSIVVIKWREHYIPARGHDVINNSHTHTKFDSIDRFNRALYRWKVSPHFDR